ncbi:winged helix-turn-helix domain-containing protein [Microbacterium elymi]|uniref:winged helix-turn-helix domain-containing protein n=1 Tax=Microbacterium elymi TaxID=2909587 RepID=UPI0033906806
MGVLPRVACRLLAVRGPQHPHRSRERAARLLALHPRRTFSRGEILEAVFDATDTPGTVDTYVHYLRRKTDRDIITTVRGRGYRLGMM